MKKNGEIEKFGQIWFLPVWLFETPVDKMASFAAAKDKSLEEAMAGASVSAPPAAPPKPKVHVQLRRLLPSCTMQTLHQQRARWNPNFWILQDT